MCGCGGWKTGLLSKLSKIEQEFSFTVLRCRLQLRSVVVVKSKEGEGERRESGVS